MKIPVYDAVATSCGFYAGFYDGKGNGSVTAHSLALYGPTIFAVASTPVLINLTNKFGRFLNRQVNKSLKNGTLEVKLKTGETKKYRDLTSQEKEEITPKIVGGLELTKEIFETASYLRPTVKVGVKTGIETLVGYVAGRVCSQFC